MAGQPCGDLLDQPAVPVRVRERRKRGVALAIRRKPARAAAGVAKLELSARTGWNTSLTLTPRSSRALHATSMLLTTRYSPCAEPGGAEVFVVPNWIEHCEPGGVNCTPRKPLSNAKLASSLHPRLA